MATIYEQMQAQLAANVAKSGGVPSTGAANPLGETTLWNQNSVANSGFTGSSAGGALPNTSTIGGYVQQPGVNFFTTPQSVPTPQTVAANAAAQAGGSNAFMASAGAGSGVGAGRIVSVTPNASNNASNYNTAALNNLIAAYTKNSDSARADSIKQHDALMAAVAGTTGKVNGYLDQLGKSGEARIAENEAKDLGKSEQDLVSRGLGNTTIRTTALRGVKRDAELNRQQLGESVASQKIGTEMSLAQLYGDALLSRQNVAPDNSYLSLIQQLAANGGRV